MWISTKHLQIELTEVTEDAIDLEEDIFDGEDELLQVMHAKYYSDFYESQIYNCWKRPELGSKMI